MVIQSTELSNVPETARQRFPTQITAGTVQSMAYPWASMWTQPQQSFGSGWMRPHHEGWPESILMYNIPTSEKSRYPNLIKWSMMMQSTNK